MEELGELSRCWEQLEGEVNSRIETMINKFERGHPVTVGDCEAIQASLTVAHQGLSRTSRQIDKKFKGSELITLGPWPLEGDSIDRAILQHYFRQGDFGLACQLAEEAGLDAEGEKRVFRELHSLLESLRMRQTKPLLAWCAMNPEIELKLAFQLHSIDYLETLLRDGAIAAIKLARSTFPPFATMFAKDISLLMGCLAYGATLERSPYADLHPRFIWEDVEDSLIEAYCRLRQLPRQSALEQCLLVGTSALPKISKVVSMVKDRKVEIELPRTLYYHSLFICPVLRSPTNGDNPPMMLACGHVICAEALNRLSRNNPAARFKCPYCPNESNANQARQVFF